MQNRKTIQRKKARRLIYALHVHIGRMEQEKARIGAPGNFYGQLSMPLQFLNGRLTIEFFRNCIKFAMLAIKTYIGKSKIISVKRVLLLRVEPLVIHSDAFPTEQI